MDLSSILSRSLQMAGPGSMCRSDRGKVRKLIVNSLKPESAYSTRDFGNNLSPDKGPRWTSTGVLLMEEASELLDETDVSPKRNSRHGFCVTAATFLLPGSAGPDIMSVAVAGLNEAPMKVSVMRGAELMRACSVAQKRKRGTQAVL